MGSEQSAPAQGGTASGPGGAQRPPVDFDYDAYLAGPNQISLAVTSLGGVPGYNAYHSSVLVNDDEFFFDGNGKKSQFFFLGFWWKQLRGIQFHCTKRNLSDSILFP